MTFVERYGPWALVTGASAGIGAEFARQLSEMGLNLVLVARRRQRLEDLARELESKNKVQVGIVAADLSRPDFLPAVLSVTSSIEVGLLVNNAGFGLAGHFLAHELEKELDLLNVNCRAVAPMTVQPVVEVAIKKLGKKPVAIPGWHNRALVYLLRFTPRRLQTYFAGKVMGNLVTP